MKTQNFTGTSKNGDINEAIANAIQKAKVALQTDIIEWTLNTTKGRNGGFLLIDDLEVEIMASAPVQKDAFPKNTEAFFICTDIDGNYLTIKLVEPDKILHARRILRGLEATRTSVQGIIVKEQAPYNTDWSYHVEPKTIDFFEVAMEVCDATIQYVEDNLEDVGGAFLPGNHWCPWTSKLVREVEGS